MTAGQAQLDRDFAFRRDQHEVRTFRIRMHVARGDFRARLKAEAQQAPARRASGEIFGEDIIGIDHRHTIGR